MNSNTYYSSSSILFEPMFGKSNNNNDNNNIFSGEINPNSQAYNININNTINNSSNIGVEVSAYDLFTPANSSYRHSLSDNNFILPISFDSNYNGNYSNGNFISPELFADDKKVAADMGISYDDDDEFDFHRKTSSTSSTSTSSTDSYGSSLSSMTNDTNNFDVLNDAFFETLAKDMGFVERCNPELSGRAPMRVNTKRTYDEDPSYSEERMEMSQTPSKERKLSSFTFEQDDGITKGPWSELEDELLREIVLKEPHPISWIHVASMVKTRNAKQCRERWTLNVNPEINHNPFTSEEDAILLRVHKELGPRWTKIKTYLPGRTENSVKTRLKSLLRKLEKYGTISPNKRNRRNNSE